MAGYIDRNPVKAKMVRWPDEYEWCSFAAAARGDARCVDGYRFIYSAFCPLPWGKVREMHEKSIHLVLCLFLRGQETVFADQLRDTLGDVRPVQLDFRTVLLFQADALAAVILTAVGCAGYRVGAATAPSRWL